MKMSKGKPPKACNYEKPRKTHGATKLIKSKHIITRSRDKIKKFNRFTHCQQLLHVGCWHMKISRANQLV
jgi:hypothetical protein